MARKITSAYLLVTFDCDALRSYQSRISRAERLFNYDVIDSHAVGCNSNQSRISRAERLFNYDVIDSHAVGCNSNKQNDPIDDALRGHHALASLPAGI